MLLISGLTGAVGVLFNGCYFRCGLRKEQVLATRAANEVLLHLLKLSLYAHYGLLTWAALKAGSLVALSALVASWALRWGLRWFSDGAFRRAGYGAMVFSGLMLLASSTQQLAQQNHIRADFHRDGRGHLEAGLQWRNNRSLEFDFGDLKFELNLSQTPEPQNGC